MPFSVITLIKNMDKYNVNMALLMTMPHFSGVNDYVAELVKKYPDRFLGCAMVNPRTDEEGVMELERCFKELNLKAVKMLTTLADFPINSEAMHPFMEVTRKYKKPFAFHVDPWDPRCNPFTAGELADSFPDVTIIMCHGARLESISVAKKHDNVILETAESPQSHEIEKCVKAIGPERIIYGSDGFGEFIEIALAKINVLKIPEEEKKLILGLNSARIFGVEVREE